MEAGSQPIPGVRQNSYVGQQEVTFRLYISLKYFNMLSTNT